MGAPFTYFVENLLQCANGQLHTIACKDNTIFNPAIGVCDHPRNVPDCADKVQQPPSSTSTDSMSTTSVVTTTTTRSGMLMFCFRCFGLGEAKGTRFIPECMHFTQHAVHVKIALFEVVGFTLIQARKYADKSPFIDHASRRTEFPVGVEHIRMLRKNRCV